MARQNHGPLSRAKGKLGGVVYQQYEGMQIAREYQPVVKNPQTEKQAENRANFKLASQTVGMFKEVINTRLAKVSIYIRKRRGIALEAIKRQITFEGGNESTLLFADAVSAINSKSLTEHNAPTVTASNNAFQVTAPADTKIIGVIAGFDSTGNYIGRKVLDMTGTAGAITVNVPVDYVAAKAMFLYTVPLSEEGRAVYSNITDPGSSLFVSIERLVNSGDMAVSDIAGEILNRS